MVYIYIFRHYKFPIPHSPADAAVGDVPIRQPTTVTGEGYEIPTSLQNGDGYSEIPGVVLESHYATMSGDYENWAGVTPTPVRTDWDMSKHAIVGPPTVVPLPGLRVQISQPAPAYDFASPARVYDFASSSAEDDAEL